MAIKTEERARQAKAMSGGSVTVTATEFDEILTRYGGKCRACLELAEIIEAGQPRSFRATLVNKTPYQGELPVGAIWIPRPSRRTGQSDEQRAAAADRTR